MAATPKIIGKPTGTIVPKATPAKPMISPLKCEWRMR